MRSILAPLLMTAPLLFFAADDKPGGGGAAPAKQSIADQLTGAQARVTELEGLQAGWNGERTALTTSRDTATSQVTDLKSQLETAAGAQSTLGAQILDLKGQLAAANTNLVAMTADRDKFKAAAEAPPSTQARVILATAGAPAVATQPAGTTHPGEAGKVAAATTPGQSGLKAAIAKAVAAKKG